MWDTRPTVEAESPERPAPEPVAPPEPEFVELVVPADAVIGLQLETTVSSDRARVEDTVEARVTRDVRVGGRVAIPAGALVHGTVTEVERGGKVRERARLGIRFHTVVLASGDKLTLRTDAITREGASPGRESAAKIGGAAVGGAILGAILGGGKGAAIGAGVGAGGGTAAVMAGERNVVMVPAGSTVSVRMRQSVTVTVEKE
jgi:type IV secretory pathway VirB10-like protein